MRVRVPEILAGVVRDNPDYARSVITAVTALGDAIRSDAPLMPLTFPAPDEAEWKGVVDRGTWLATEWFSAECYVYRCLMSVVRYWETGRDPFLPAKRRELEDDGLWDMVGKALDFARSDVQEAVTTLLGFALWGNRGDLSYAVGKAFGAHGAAADLLVDDRDLAVRDLLTPGGDIHIVADNTGRELSMDLVLADVLLGASDARVGLHVKMHPMFVSDATAPDVWELLSAMRRRGGAAGDLAARLGCAFDEERLRVLPDFFWNGPRFFWDRPSRLAKVLDGATIVVLKGDANYRRAVGDAIWPAPATFSEATDYFPAPLLCLRTMKSDALVGISPQEISELDLADAKWRINGRRGLIQAKGR
jgi:hypothetical protein